jgi:selenide,water dikinase
MRRYPINSCTDVTGFGLFGHAFEMARGSQTSFLLDSKSMPLLPDVRDMAKMGIIPAGAYANRNYLIGDILADPSIPLDLLDVMFDPQTSGGLLISLPEKKALKLLADLKGEIPHAEIIGQVISQDVFTIIIE